MKIVLEKKDYPKTIEIGDETYSVVFVERTEEDDYGMCDQTNKIIIISLNQDSDEMLKTFWHEVLHGFEEEFKVKLGHKVINKLEHVLAQVQAQFYRRK